MKKLILLIISIFMVISCGKTVKNNDNKLKVKNFSILSLLPENAEAIMNIKSIASIFKNFKITENSAFGQKLQGKNIKEIKDILGINPLNIKDLESIGIDINKNLGISFDTILLKENGNNLNSLNTIIYLPLKNKSKLLAYIDSRFKNGKLLSKKPAEVNYKKEKNYIKFFGNKKNEMIYVFVKNNYLFIIANPFNPESSLKLTDDIIASKSSLKNSKLYNDMNKLGTNKGIYFYGNIESFIKNNKKIISKELDNSKTMIEMIEAYQAFSIQISLDTKEFILDLSAKLKSGKILSLLKGIKYNNSTILGINKNPLLLFSFGLNVNAYANLIKDFAKEYMQKQNLYNQKITKENSSVKQEEKTKSDFDKTLNKEITKLNKEYGFDIQKDLIDNLDGNFAFATYDGMSISTTSYNSVVTIGLKNTKTIEMIIDKLLVHKNFTKLKAFVNKTVYKNNTVYIINAMVTQVYVGFKNNELIIASSKDMYDKALNSKRKEGYYKYSKKDANLSSSIKSDMIFYISFLEVIKALNNFKAMIPAKGVQKAQDILELLDYFLIKANLKDNIASANYILKTNSNKLFFIALIDYFSIKTPRSTQERPMEQLAPKK